MAMDSWSSTTTAMPMMLFMIWTARICKADEFVLNLPVILETAVEAAAVVVEDVSAAVEAAVVIGMADAVPVETHLDPGPITDLLSKTCLLVHLGRT